MGNKPPHKQTGADEAKYTNRYTYKKRKQSDSKTEEASSTAVTVIGKPIRLRDLYTPQPAPLPAVLMQNVEEYNPAVYGFTRVKYIVDLPSVITWFGKPIATLTVDTEILGTLILAGKLQQVEAMLKAALTAGDTQILYREIEAKSPGPFGLSAIGTPLMLAATAGDHPMVQMIRALFTNKADADAQLSYQFRDGWQEATRERMNQLKQLLSRFADQLIEAKLPAKGMTLTDAKKQCKEIILEYRSALEKRAEGPASTIGLLFDPQVFPDSYDEIFLPRKEKLGGCHVMS